MPTCSTKDGSYRPCVKLSAYASVLEPSSQTSIPIADARLTAFLHGKVYDMGQSMPVDVHRLPEGDAILVELHGKHTVYSDSVYTATHPDRNEPVCDKWVSVAKWFVPLKEQAFEMSVPQLCPTRQNAHNITLSARVELRDFSAEHMNIVNNSPSLDDRINSMKNAMISVQNAKERVLSSALSKRIPANLVDKMTDQLLNKREIELNCLENYSTYCNPEQYKMMTNFKARAEVRRLEIPKSERDAMFKATLIARCMHQWLVSVQDENQTLDVQRMTPLEAVMGFNSALEKVISKNKYAYDFSSCVVFGNDLNNDRCARLKLSTHNGENMGCGMHNVLNDENRRKRQREQQAQIANLKKRPDAHTKNVQEKIYALKLGIAMDYQNLHMQDCEDSGMAGHMVDTLCGVLAEQMPNFKLSQETGKLFADKQTQKQVDKQFRHYLEKRRNCGNVKMNLALVVAGGAQQADNGSAPIAKMPYNLSPEQTNLMMRMGGLAGHCLGYVGVVDEIESHHDASSGFKVHLAREQLMMHIEGTAETYPCPQVTAGTSFRMKHSASTPDDERVMSHSPPTSTNLVSGHIVATKFACQACALVQGGGVPVISGTEIPDASNRFNKRESEMIHARMTQPAIKPNLTQQEVRSFFVQGDMNTKAAVVQYDKDGQTVIIDAWELLPDDFKTIEGEADSECRLETYAGSYIPLQNTVLPLNEKSNLPRNVKMDIEVSEDAFKKFGPILPSSTASEEDLCMQYINANGRIREHRQPYMLHLDGTVKPMPDINDYIQNTPTFSLSCHLLADDTERSHAFLKKLMVQYGADRVLVSNRMNTSVFLHFKIQKMPITCVRHYASSEQESVDDSSDPLAYLDVWRAH